MLPSNRENVYTQGVSRIDNSQICIGCLLPFNNLDERHRCPHCQNIIIVATGGCFDILHAGHIKFLRRAASFGDRLLVLVNSDNSMRRIKREPINNLADRILILESIRYVSRVYHFEEDDPSKLLLSIKPDIWVKGSEYRGIDIPEASVVPKIEYIERTDISSSSIIERIRNSG